MPLDGIVSPDPERDPESSDPVILTAPDPA